MIEYNLVSTVTGYELNDCSSILAEVGVILFSSNSQRFWDTPSILSNCDMASESWDSSLLGNSGKEVPAEIYAHETTEKLPLLCNSEANTPL